MKAAKGRVAWNKGITCSEETREKLRLSHLGQKSWNKGRTGIYSVESLEKMRKSHIGQKVSEETKKKISETNKGCIGYWLGKKLSEEHKLHISKPESTNYRTIHWWVQRVLGKPNKCEYCDNTNAKAYDWANIDHTYKRDINDWVRLCRSCHIKFDRSRI